MWFEVVKERKVNYNIFFSSFSPSSHFLFFLEKGVRIYYSLDNEGFQLQLEDIFPDLEMELTDESSFALIYNSLESSDDYHLETKGM